MAAEKVDDTTAATIAEAAAGAPVEQPAEPEHKLPPLDIRVFEERDYADVRQLVGDNTMQLARVLNTKIYMHPLTVALWAILLGILVNYSRTLKTHDWGRLMLLMAALSSCFLVAVEFYTRARFETIATEQLKEPSLENISQFFGKPERFQVATLGGDIIGCVGLHVEGRVGTLKHWHVFSRYRNRGLGWDLVEVVLESNKGTKKNALQKVKAQTYNLQKRAEKSLKDHGFKQEGKEVKLPGALGWFGVTTKTWVKEL